ncbi:metal-dependent hydrolase [Myxococcota bacterium]|nr:metal-dependent hydrolase [Myxococcota bacterium]
MDILTHVGVGCALAAPLWAEHPVVAASFLLGNALPDADVLARLGGKRAFLAAHQTLSHGAPTAALLGLVWAWGLGALGLEEGAWAAGVALSAGMILHATLDWTNTFGVTLAAPLSWRRRCAEWIFFIDAGAIALTLGALAWIVARWPSPGGWPSGIYAASMGAWWLCRAALRRRAARRAPEGTITLVPSAWHPLRFYGVAEAEGAVELFTLRLGRGVERRRRVLVYDAEFIRALEKVPEWRAMRRLSPAYHAVEVERAEAHETWLTCRDLRTRNFRSTRYGELRVRLQHGEAASWTLRI